MGLTIITLNLNSKELNSISEDKSIQNIFIDDNDVYFFSNFDRWKK